jgi:hypothetical protein
VAFPDKGALGVNTRVNGARVDWEASRGLLRVRVSCFYYWVLSLSFYTLIFSVCEKLSGWYGSHTFLLFLVSLSLAHSLRSIPIHLILYLPLISGRLFLLCVSGLFFSLLYIPCPFLHLTEGTLYRKGVCGLGGMLSPQNG